MREDSFLSTECYSVHSIDVCTESSLAVTGDPAGPRFESELAAVLCF